MKWDTLKPVVVLTVICLVVSAALVGTYNMTKPVIDAATAAEEKAALVAVLPNGTSFDKVDCDVENVLEAYKDAGGSGYVFKSQGKGFAGMITLMVGVDSNGKITGTKVMDHSETAGIGTQIEKESFQAQYVGKNSSLEDVETITGATFSSKGFNTAIKAAFAGYAKLSGTSAGSGASASTSTDTTTASSVMPDASLISSFIGANYTEKAIAGVDSAYISDTGYAFNVSSEGFHGLIHVLVAIDKNGAIIGTSMYQQQETPDYGAKLANDSYSAKWVGLTETSEFPTKSGATITSTAYQNAVKAAFKAYDTVKGA